MDDMALLREYAGRNSEAAFEELVSRRIGFVYSAALRQVRDPHLAQEVTQAVFVLLAQKAGQLRQGTVLSGWLFKTTRYAALAQMRAVARRRQRELEAQMQSQMEQTAPDSLWDQVSPLLDQALATLGEKDRQAVLLRFFENKSLAEVGRKLGTGEDGARKRVSRAVEKLHGFLTKRGIASTSALIAGAISVNSVQAAPAVLAKSVTAAAVTQGVVTGGPTLTLINGALRHMAWTKLKIAAVGAVILAVASATTIVIRHQISSRGSSASRQAALWNKDSLAFAGYQTPQATLQTMLWAMSNGDTNVFLACASPELRAKTEEQWRGKSTEALAAEGKALFSTLSGVRLLGQTEISSDRVMLTVYLEGPEKTERLVFRRIGQEWKQTR